MAASIQPTVNDLAVQRLLRGAVLRFKDLSPAMREIGEYHLLATDQRWEREVAPDGTRWRDLRPATVARKRNAGRIVKILQETGTARASINYRADRFSVSTGTPQKYMATHQKDRRFLGYSDDDLGEVKTILTNYLVKGR